MMLAPSSMCVLMNSTSITLLCKISCDNRNRLSKAKIANYRLLNSNLRGSVSVQIQTKVNLMLRTLSMCLCAVT